MQWLKNNSSTGTNQLAENISLLKLTELKEKIKEYQSLDYDNSTIAEVDVLLRKIIPGFFVYPLEMYRGPIFRARKHSNYTELFHNTKELIYPVNPQKYGRLNNIGESIFYGALNKSTAMVEMRLKIGDVITVLESKRIKTKTPLLLMEVGMKELIIKANEKPDFTKLQSKRFAKKIKSEEARLRYDIINTFLNDEITRIISDDEAHKYKATIPIGQYYIQGNPETQGMLYPSISHVGATCIALKPNSYHNFFQPEVCHKLRVTNLEPSGNIIVMCENSSTSIEKNGKINWLQ